MNAANPQQASNTTGAAAKRRAARHCRLSLRESPSAKFGEQCPLRRDRTRIASGAKSATPTGRTAVAAPTSTASHHTGHSRRVPYITSAISNSINDSL